MSFIKQHNPREWYSVGEQYPATAINCYPGIDILILHWHLSQLSDIDIVIFSSGLLIFLLSRPRDNHCYYHSILPYRSCSIIILSLLHDKHQPSEQINIHPVITSWQSLTCAKQNSFSSPGLFNIHLAIDLWQSLTFITLQGVPVLRSISPVLTT